MTDYYSHEEHGPFELFNIGTLELEEGGLIENCNLAVATFGELNANKDNAILIPTWYSGTSKIIEQVYIGQGRALDPEKYFIIVVNQIGNGLSTSPSNAEEVIRGSNFPKVRIGDDVSAQYRLLTKHFGLDSLKLVVGGSMGAQQTYEWAVRFPDFVEHAAAVAGTAKNSEYSFLFAETLVEAIISEPGYKAGLYHASDDVFEGLKRHAKMWTVMGWSTEFFREGEYQALGFESMQAFVDGFMVQYFAPMDPNNLLTMAWKWQNADVSRNTNGNLAVALDSIKAKTYVIPISHDMFFTESDCKAEQELISDSEFRPLNSTHGHLALFGTDSGMLEQFDNHLKELLE